METGNYLSSCSGHAVEPAYDDPKFDVLTNTYGTFLICNLAKKLNIKKFIYASSAAAIGNNSKKIMNENIKVSQTLCMVLQNIMVKCL